MPISEDAPYPACLWVALCFAVPAAAAVTFEPGPGRASWRRLTLTQKWDMPATSAAEYEKLPDHFALRVQSDSLLVALAQPFGEHPTIVSSNPQVVDLRTGNVRGAQPGEWETGKPIAAHVEAPFRESPLVLGTTVSYARRQFLASGAIFEGYALSPDGSWLALMSYIEDVNRGRRLFDAAVPAEVLHVDIFQVSTGEKAAQLSRLGCLERSG